MLPVGEQGISPLGNYSSLSIAHICYPDSYDHPKSLGKNCLIGGVLGVWRSRRRMGGALKHSESIAGACCIAFFMLIGERCSIHSPQLRLLDALPPVSLIQAVDLAIRSLLGQ